MAGIAITLVSGSVSGGTGSDTVTSQDFADAAAAVTAIASSASGFFVVSNPVSLEGKTLKKTAFSTSQIRTIVSL